MVISANFKTNKTREETKEYLNTLEQNLHPSTSSEIIVFPPTTALQHHIGRVEIGVQNSYPVERGAFTGEIGLEQLEEFGIRTILIGHSERREILKESQDEVAKKFQFFAEKSFKIIYCIGEPLEIRKEGREKLFHYLENQFRDIPLEYSNYTIAYEPIWAIGTGITPTMEEIEEVLKWIKEKTDRKVIYGGSVKVANIEEILRLPSCDGVLVGSASLEVTDFIKMINISEDISKS